MELVGLSTASPPSVPPRPSSSATPPNNDGDGFPYFEILPEVDDAGWSAREFSTEVIQRTNRAFTRFYTRTNANHPLSRRFRTRTKGMPPPSTNPYERPWAAARSRIRTAVHVHGRPWATVEARLVVSIGSTEPTSRKTPLPPSKYRLMWYTDLLSSHRAAPATERRREEERERERGGGIPHYTVVPSSFSGCRPFFFSLFISRDLSSLFPRLSCIPFLLVFFISLVPSLWVFDATCERYIRLFNLFVFFSHMRVYSNLILQRCFATCNSVH